MCYVVMCCAVCDWECVHAWWEKGWGGEGDQMSGAFFLIYHNILPALILIYLECKCLTCIWGKAQISIIFMMKIIVMMSHQVMIMA